MRFLKETFQTFRSKITNPDVSMQSSEMLNATGRHLDSAVTIFDLSVEAKNPRYLDNHLSAHRAEVKLFEIAPKLR